VELLYEFGILALMLASGIGLAFALGVRGAVLVPAGLAVSAVLRTLSHSLLEIFGQAQLGLMTWLILSSGALLFSLAKSMREREYGIWLAAGAVAALIGPLVTRGLGLRGIPHSDSLWILTLSDLMQRAGDLEIVGGRTAIKRGFSFPMLLSLGPEGEFLSGLIVVIFIALVLAIYWAITELAPKLNQRQWLWIVLPVALLLLTAPIVWRAVLYVNGHTLTAIGVTMAAAAVAFSVRDQQLSRANLLVIALGLALISTTRPEGVAFAAVIAAPLISRRWISRWDVRLIAGSALMSFGLWMYVYDGYIPNLIRLYDERFPVAMLIGTFLVGLKIFDFLRFRLVPLAFAGMAAILVFVLTTNFSSLTDDIWAQTQNIFLGAGFWGTFFVALVPTLIAIGRRDLSAGYQTLLTISLLMTLGSFVAKLMDGGLFGDPTLGRIGWTDSLNRMWLHVFGIFLVTAIVGLAERTRQLERIAK
jgi:hypothetical protein